MISDGVWNSDGVHDAGYEQNAGTVTDSAGGKIEAGAAPKADEGRQVRDGRGRQREGRRFRRQGGHQVRYQEERLEGQRGDAGVRRLVLELVGIRLRAIPEEVGPRAGHWETDYGQVWVPNVVYVRHGRFICNACGATFDSKNGFYAHSDAMYAQGQNHDGYTDDSYTTSEDQGHYEQQATGRHWVVDVAGHWE